MKQRFLASLVALAVAALAHLSGQIATPAQTKPAGVQKDLAAKTKAGTIPRTPDGHPDLQGIWTNATLTPVERPLAWRPTGAGLIADLEQMRYRETTTDVASAVPARAAR